MDRHKIKSSKVGVILQARTGSKRLPGKVLLKIGDKSLLEHIFERYSQSGLNYEIILATSNLEKDDILAEFAHKNEIKLYELDDISDELIEVIFNPFI